MVRVIIQQQALPQQQIGTSSSPGSLYDLTEDAIHGSVDLPQLLTNKRTVMNNTPRMTSRIHWAECCFRCSSRENSELVMGEFQFVTPPFLGWIQPEPCSETPWYAKWFFEVRETGDLESTCSGCASNLFTESCNKWYHTVDGRNPAPVDMANIPWFAGFHASQVVQDFFHQQYHPTMVFYLQYKWRVT